MRALILYELNYYIKNRIELIQFTGLFFIIVLLVPFGQSAVNFHYQSFAGGITWIALITAISLCGSSLFQRDYDSGKLEAYQTANISLEAIIFAKWLAFIVAMGVALAIILPAMLLLLNMPLSVYGHYLVGLESGILDLSLITATIATMVIGARRVGAVLALILLPLSIPIIIFGAHYLVSEALIQPSLIFMLGFAALMLPILCLAGASCISASN